MITLCAGLRNSLVVLELLRNDESMKDVDIYVQSFHNCREMGLTFTAGKRTYCVYEHRNSDEIIVNHSDEWGGIGASLPYMGDKYTYDKGFSPGAYEACATFLAERLKEAASQEAQCTT